MNQLAHAMRFGAPDPETVQAYLCAGDPLRPDLCNRTFVLYIAGERDVATCEKFLRGFCYRQFHGGQMEQVLEDLVCVSYIRTPAEVLSIIRELRKFGIIGAISLEAEYAQGYPVSIKTY